VPRNTVYLCRAVVHVRRSGRNIPDHLLKHVSPLGWENINLTGTYSWDEAPTITSDRFRALRLPEPQAQAA